MTKVTREIAQQDIDRWLDFKKVGQSKREKKSEEIDNLVDSVADGYLVVNDDYTLKHILKFPLEGGIPVKELIYQTRLEAVKIKSRMQNLKAGDGHGVLMGYICALTDQAAGIIGKLDTEDYNIAGCIVVFFV